MTKILITRVSQLIQPSSYWMSENSITLKDGEIGVDKDLGIYKIGDGVSKWKDLPVFFTGLKLDGSTVLNGGATSFDGGDLYNTCGVLLKAVQELSSEVEELKRKLGCKPEG